MEKANAIVNEVKKVIIGKDIIIKKVLMVILAKGHILLEDIPGVGKTTLAVAYARALSLETKRMQFTPDVMPSDVVGFSMLDKHNETMRFVPGAAFTNLFLADEINRTSSKTQSALLEVMEEGKISVDGYTQEVPRPFMVIATQNPIGSAGTQLLPESQMDRFMVRLSIGYPSIADEIQMLKSKEAKNPLSSVEAVANVDDILAMQEGVEKIYVSDEAYEYMLHLIDATRNHEEILQGASPRATVSLCMMAKSCAFLSDRDYVVPQDVQAVFIDTIAHRIILRNEEQSQKACEKVLAQMMQGIRVPAFQKR